MPDKTFTQELFDYYSSTRPDKVSDIEHFQRNINEDPSKREAMYNLLRNEGALDDTWNLEDFTSTLNDEYQPVLADRKAKQVKEKRQAQTAKVVADSGQEKVDQFTSAMNQGLGGYQAAPAYKPGVGPLLSQGQPAEKVEKKAEKKLVVPAATEEQMEQRRQREKELKADPVTPEQAREYLESTQEMLDSTKEGIDKLGNLVSQGYKEPTLEEKVESAYQTEKLKREKKKHLESVGIPTKENSAEIDWKELNKFASDVLSKYGYDQAEVKWYEGLEGNNPTTLTRENLHYNLNRGMVPGVFATDTKEDISKNEDRAYNAALLLEKISRHAQQETEVLTGKRSGGWQGLSENTGIDMVTDLISDAPTIMKIAEKFENGEELLPIETKVLNALIESKEVQASLSDENRWYRFGKTGRSLAEFLISLGLLEGLGVTVKTGQVAAAEAGKRLIGQVIKQRLKSMPGVFASSVIRYPLTYVGQRSFAQGATGLYDMGAGYSEDGKYDIEVKRNDKTMAGVVAEDWTRNAVMMSMFGLFGAINDPIMGYIAKSPLMSKTIGKVIKPIAEKTNSSVLRNTMRSIGVTSLPVNFVQLPAADLLSSLSVGDIDAIKNMGTARYWEDTAVSSIMFQGFNLMTKAMDLNTYRSKMSQARASVNDFKRVRFGNETLDKYQEDFSGLFDVLTAKGNKGFELSLKKMKDTSRELQKTYSEKFDEYEQARRDFANAKGEKGSQKYETAREKVEKLGAELRQYHILGEMINDVEVQLLYAKGMTEGISAKFKDYVGEFENETGEGGYVTLVRMKDTGEIYFLLKNKGQMSKLKGMTKDSQAFESKTNEYEVLASVPKEQYVSRVVTAGIDAANMIEANRGVSDKIIQEYNARNARPEDIKPEGQQTTSMVPAGRAEPRQAGTENAAVPELPGAPKQLPAAETAVPVEETAERPGLPAPVEGKPAEAPKAEERFLYEGKPVEILSEPGEDGSVYVRFEDGTADFVDVKDITTEGQTETAPEVQTVKDEVLKTAEEGGDPKAVLDSTNLSEGEKKAVLEDLVEEQTGQQVQTGAPATAEQSDIRRTPEGDIDYDDLMQRDPQRFVQEFDAEFGQGAALERIKAIANGLDAEIAKLQKSLEKPKSMNDAAKMLRQLKTLTEQKEALDAALTPKEEVAPVEEAKPEAAAPVEAPKEEIAPVAEEKPDLIGDAIGGEVLPEEKTPTEAAPAEVTEPVAEKPEVPAEPVAEKPEPVKETPKPTEEGDFVINVGGRVQNSTMEVRVKDNTLQNRLEAAIDKEDNKNEEDGNWRNPDYVEAGKIYREYREKYGEVDEEIARVRKAAREEYDGYLKEKIEEVKRYDGIDVPDTFDRGEADKAFDSVVALWLGGKTIKPSVGDRWTYRFHRLESAAKEAIDKYVKAEVKKQAARAKKKKVEVSPDTPENNAIKEDIAKRKKKKFNPYNYTAKEPTRPVMESVFYDKDNGGWAVASNAHIFIASKDLYDEKNAGKKINKKGIEIKGVYPDWPKIFKPAADKIPINKDYVALYRGIRLINEAKKKLEAKEKGSSKNMYASVAIGEGVAKNWYNADLLEKFLDAAVHFGIDPSEIFTFGTTRPMGFDTAKAKGLIMPIRKSNYGGQLDVDSDGVLRSSEPYIREILGLEEENKVSETDGIKYSKRLAPAPKKTGIGYKVFVLKDGKLYPPMVANPNGAETPLGVWLDADAAPQAGVSKTGRPQVKAGGKGTQGGSGTLSYRPGWHLGEIPYAIQFNRLNPETGNKELFPNNFVWAEVEYANDKDYQKEAEAEGITAKGNFQHSLAGLKRVPVDGSYRYRTNPNPETDPWIITGAMKVNRILSRQEVDDMVRKAGREPQPIQEGDILSQEAVDNLNEQIREAKKQNRYNPYDRGIRNAVVQKIEKAGIPVITDEAEGQAVLDAAKRLSYRKHAAYHGSGSLFEEFDHSHMGEGEGVQAYGWGTYVTEVKGIGKAYAESSAKRSPELQKELDELMEETGRLRDEWQRAQAKTEVLEENVNRLQRGIISLEALNGLNEEQYKDFIKRYVTDIDAKYPEGYEGVMDEDVPPELEDQPQYVLDAIEFLHTPRGEEYMRDRERLDAKEMNRLYQSMRKELENSKEEFIKATYEQSPLYFNYLRARTEQGNPKYNPSSYLYEVEIPDDNGNNYITYGKELSPEQTKQMKDAVRQRLLSDSESGYDETNLRELNNDLNKFDNISGEAVVGSIQVWLGVTDKEASEFLSDLGYVGIKYPAQFRTGGRSDNASNFVIFNEKDLKIKSNIKLFKSEDGTEIYGFTKNGKIYLDPNAPADTPIHEYTHLWAEMFRKLNPKEWENITKLMKDTGLWDKVKENYPELTEESDLAEEVLSYYSGKRGAERLKAEMKRISSDKNLAVSYKMKALKALQNLRNAIEKFWRTIAEYLGIKFTTAEEVADRVLADIDRGINPKEVIKAVEESQPMFTKAEEVLSFFNKRGFKNGEIVRSITDHGVSTYIEGKWGLMDAKYRISDHGLGRERAAHEIQFSLTDSPEEIFRRNIGFNGKVFERSGAEKLRAENYQKLLEENKDALAGLSFEKVINSRVPLEEFVKENEEAGRAKYLQQRVNKDGSFTYEFSVPATEGKSAKPSIKFMENFEGSSVGAKNETANERFNDELDKFRDGTLKGEIHLGQPSRLLQACGINATEMFIKPKVLKEHLKKHNLSVDDIRQLPQALQTPFLVYEWGTKAKSMICITDLVKSDGRKITVAIKMIRNGRAIELNEIAGVYGKEAERFLSEMENASEGGLEEALRYVRDKKETLDWLGIAPPKGAAPKNKQESIAKIIDEFENPKIIEEDSDIRFSKAYRDTIDESKQTVQDKTEAAKVIRKAKLDEANGKVGGMVRRTIQTAQRGYDRATVDIIADMARDLMKEDLIDNPTKMEMQKVITLLSNTTAKEKLEGIAHDLMDIMVDNQLRNYSNLLSRFEKMKIKKKDQSGVVAQGSLGLFGQKAMDAFKEWKGANIDDLDTHIDDVLARMHDAEGEEYDELMAEYDGLEVAYNFLKEIKESKEKETALKADFESKRKDLYKDYKDGKITFKNYSEFLKNYRETLLKMRADRADAYRKVCGQLQQIVVGGKLEGSIFRQMKKDRADQIFHNANSDMKGMRRSEHSEPKGIILNSWPVRWLTTSLPTYDMMFRAIGYKSPKGEGYSWDYFVRNGWITAAETEYVKMQEGLDAIENKLQELMGLNVNGLYGWNRAQKSPIVARFFDGGEMKDHELSQLGGLYIYMVNKMADGKMTLRAMGIDQDAIDEMVSVIDPRLIKFADWVQSEFLPGLRERYNQVHEKLFGASMDAIEEYFPLKRNKNSRKSKVEMETFDQQGLSIVTGAIKKRTKNTVALDIMNNDALSVLLSHVREMEHWAAFAQLSEDLRTLLSYNSFRNAFRNMRTPYGTGERLLTRLEKVCQIAVGQYKKAGKISEIDELGVVASRGVTAGKIAFRIFTAWKQIYSAPAFLADADPLVLMKNFGLMFTGKTWNWCIDNLPLFQKRWKSRIAGDTRLFGLDSDYKAIKRHLVKSAARLGMTPNAFMDGLTISVGAKSIYDVKRRRYIREGFPVDTAEEMARRDANMYNESQQSAESAFVAPIQVDRTFFSAALTVFRNASMGYTRQAVDAAWNITKMLTPGYRKESVEQTTKQLIRQGLEAEQAERAAKKRYNRGYAREAIRLAVYGWLLPYLWYLAAHSIYSLFGDNEKKAEDNKKKAQRRAWIGPVEGFAGGNVIATAWDLFMNDGNTEYFDTGTMPITSDVENIIRLMGRDKVSGWNEVINFGIQAGIGINPATLTDAICAISDAVNGDMETTKEVLLCIAKIFQVPKSDIEQLYIDELDMKGGEALKLTPGELAKRYAREKVRREAFFTGQFYDDAERKDIEGKKAKGFLKKVAEREKLQEPDEFKAAEDDIKAFNKTLSQLKKDLKEAETAELREEARAALNEFMQAPEYKDYLRKKGLMGQIKSKEKIMKAAQEGDRQKLQREIDSLRQEIIKINEEKPE